MRTIFLPEVDSTNEWIKRNIDSLQDGDVVYAGIQTQGKGREGKKWHSPPGGLWMSVLLEKEAPYNF
ncbi:biotin--[acetyl-CoA-carboxylase] ligase, partial [bacterium]